MKNFAFKVRNYEYFKASLLSIHCQLKLTPISGIENAIWAMLDLHNPSSFSVFFLYMHDFISFSI